MPLEKRPAQANRGSPVAPPRRPFHLHLPDVFAEEKSRETSGPGQQPPRQTVANDPSARARSQLTGSQLTGSQLTGSQFSGPQLTSSSQKKYQDGQQQVTGMIERMRERRRKLFDRLWITSIALTALSILALAVELIQGMHSPTQMRAANPPVKTADSPGRLVHKTSAAPAQPVATAAAHALPNDRRNDPPVTSALYTTEDGPQPNRVWLDGLIADPDSGSDMPSDGVQHDNHQSRTP